ncbi:Zinc finger protein [Oopsacas minuta]|uniref:Zinc finger protein n=1 Tax=Oopsacas minuta TaxID=111878 RepID=A0AAV7JSC7_9METZ|nr:Zinc finger protein [Oopsacas minuta]
MLSVGRNGEPVEHFIKPSDTRWLAHVKCVKVEKENYSAIVVTLDNIYEQTHEPEALGLSKVLSKETTLAAIFLLAFSLPLLTKLNKCLQTEELHLTSIPSLVDAHYQ